MSRDAPAGRPARRRVITPEEARIWRAVVRDAIPLPGRELAPDEDTAEAPAPAPPPPVRAEVVYQPQQIPPRPRPAPELGHGNAPGLDKRSAERMKRGDMAIDARLDLHGMTQDGAHAALTALITRSFDAGRRCLLVITGKGGREGAGVLRAMVPRWLNQTPLRERIIGFSYAQPRHGGEGALYVLVRRRRG
ncbi:MAG: Smr/MutS family protein [Actinomycetota bacterium]